ncbi:MAG: aspartate--tRNA ligase [Chitinophagaceae bacterium]
MSQFNTFHRTHHCAALSIADVNTEVRLAGWVSSVRKMGKFTFLVLRDHYGITQLIVDSDAQPETFETASRLKSESVVFAKGKVRARSPKDINKSLPTGEIEVECTEIIIDSLVENLPFPLNDDNVNEELRLKYRFIDLRRNKLHQNIILRTKVIFEIRKFMIQEGFLELQTPILTVSSPEGARDYVVPSRVHPGKFYALPQAPQQYKQLLMCSGFDRYFQIAPCFRDEDARADRSPGEFYQLDMEMAFIDKEDLFTILERMFEHLTKTVSSKRVLQVPFPRMTYDYAMNTYGNDKPDIRYDVKISDITEQAAALESDFFKNALTGDNRLRVIKAPGSAGETRKFYDRLNDVAKKHHPRGIVYVYKDAEGFKSNWQKQISQEDMQKLQQITDLAPEDCLFICIGEKKLASKTLGVLRPEIAAHKNLIEKDLLAFCWIVDFPMYEFNEEDNKIDFSHNPFSMPQGGMNALQNQDPLSILADQYDIVCNGYELSSGAIRNHRPDIMYKAFDIAGYSKEQVDEKFGHMISAFSYGAPPHGGIAPGVDRIVMIYADEPNIREVITFPMNQRAQELMMGSPAEITQKQLKELNIKIAE